MSSNLRLTDKPIFSQIDTIMSNIPNRTMINETMSIAVDNNEEIKFIIIHRSMIDLPEDKCGTIERKGDRYNFSRSNLLDNVHMFNALEYMYDTRKWFVPE